MTFKTATSLMTISIVFLVTTITIVAHIASAQLGTWDFPNSYPVGREEFGFATTDGAVPDTHFLVILGGQDAKGGPIASSSFYVFDPSTNIFQKYFIDGWDSSIVGFQLHATLDANTLSATNCPICSLQLLAISGRRYGGNEPVSTVRHFEFGSTWTEITPPTKKSADDATATAEPGEAFWFGSWSKSGGSGYDDVITSGGPRSRPDCTGIFMYGGVKTSGFTTSATVLVYNRTQGIKNSATWEKTSFDDAPINPITAVEGVDYPTRAYGACCASDPGAGASTTVAYCFGGTNPNKDSNQVWKVDYSQSGAAAWTFINATALPIPGSIFDTRPLPRRHAACAFVGPGQFAVFGGTDSATGGAYEDFAYTYILDVTWEVWLYPIAPPSTATTTKLVPATGAKMASCYYATNNTYRSWLFGGSRGEYNNENLYTWDTYLGGTGGWILQEINQLRASSVLQPPARSFLGAVNLRGEIYLMNGKDRYGDPLNDAWRFNLTSQTWNQVTFAIPWEKRWGADSALVAGLVMFYGGWAEGDGSSSSSTTRTTLRQLVVADVIAGQVAVTRDADLVSTSTQKQEPPYGRAWHCSFSQNNQFIIYGGKDDTFTTRGEIFSFDVILQQWQALKLTESSSVYVFGGGGGGSGSTTAEELAKILPRYGHLALRVNRTHSIVGLGFSQTKTLYDFYWVHNSSARHGTITFTPFELWHPFLQGPEKFVRAFAGGIHAGQYMMVCGGIVAPDPGITPPHDASCYFVDTKNYYFFPFGGTDPAWILTGSAMTTFGDKMFIVGGLRSSGLTATSSVNEDVLRYTFHASDLCPIGETIDCVQCSPASTPSGPAPFVTCSPSPLGHYVEDSSKPPQPCPAGTFLEATGGATLAECIPCSFGTFQPQTGSASCLPCDGDVSSHFCPIGATSSLPVSSPQAVAMRTRANAVPVEIHPADYENPPVPLFPVMFVAMTMILVLIVVVFIVVLGIYSHEKRKRRFLSERTERMLVEAYETFSVGKYGMSESCFLTALMATSQKQQQQQQQHQKEEVVATTTATTTTPTTDATTEKKKKSLVPRHSIDIDFAHRLFITIDKYKTGFLQCYQWIDAIVLAIEEGRMEKHSPREEGEKEEEEEEEGFDYETTGDTEEAKKDPNSSGQEESKKKTLMEKVAKLKLEDLDIFLDHHLRATVGESAVLIKTWYGGLLTLCFITAVVALIMIIILDFLLTNIKETKSAVPRAVIRGAFDESLIQVSGPITASVQVFGLLRQSQGIASLRQACVDVKSSKYVAMVAKFGATAVETSKAFAQVEYPCASARAIVNGFRFKSQEEEKEGQTSSGGNDGGGDDRTQQQLLFLNSMTNLTCSYDRSLDACTVKWHCPACHVVEGAGALSAASGNITFLVSSAMAGTGIRSRVEVGTGLKALTQNFYGKVDVAGGALEYSVTEHSIPTPTNNSLFSGFPASEMIFGLTPTYFEAENLNNLWGGVEKARSVGYHVRLNTDPSPGNSISPELFDRYFDVPVALKFTVDTTPLLVRRILYKSIVEMIAGLAGALSGLYGATVALLQILDRLGVNKKYQEEKNLFEEQDEREEKREHAEEEMEQRRTEIAAKDIFGSSSSSSSHHPFSPTPAPRRHSSDGGQKQPPRQQQQQREEEQQQREEEQQVMMVEHIFNNNNNNNNNNGQEQEQQYDEAAIEHFAELSELIRTGLTVMQSEAILHIMKRVAVVVPVAGSAAAAAAAASSSSSPSQHPTALDSAPRELFSPTAGAAAFSSPTNEEIKSDIVGDDPLKPSPPAPTPMVPFAFPTPVALPSTDSSSQHHHPHPHQQHHRDDVLCEDDAPSRRHIVVDPCREVGDSSDNSSRSSRNNKRMRNSSEERNARRQQQQQQNRRRQNRHTTAAPVVQNNDVDDDDDMEVTHTIYIP